MEISKRKIDLGNNLFCSIEWSAESGEIDSIYGKIVDRTNINSETYYDFNTYLLHYKNMYNNNLETIYIYERFPSGFRDKCWVPDYNDFEADNWKDYLSGNDINDLAIKNTKADLHTFCDYYMDGWFYLSGYMKISFRTHLKGNYGTKIINFDIGSAAITATTQDNDSYRIECESEMFYEILSESVIAIKDLSQKIDNIEDLIKNPPDFTIKE